MTAARDWSAKGADAIIDHLHPVLKEAGQTGDKDAILQAYAGALGAWWGALMADAGPEYGPQIAELLVGKMMKISLKEQMN